MELKLKKEEVREIILAWAEKEIPGKFNTVHFVNYGNEVELTFAAPEPKEEEQD